MAKEKGKGKGKGRYTQEEKPTNNHIFIKSVDKGDTFTGVYYLEAVYEKTAVNGNAYSDLTLRDGSGSTFARLWGTTDATKGSFVEVTGNGGEYLNKLQITVNTIEKVSKPEEMINYVAKSETQEEDHQKIADCKIQIVEVCNEVDDQTCQCIIDSVFSNSGFDFKFENSPCSLLPHYGVSGGLLAHTANTMSLAMDIAKRFNLNSEKMAILLTASLLHEVGAVDAYSIDSCAPEKTIAGELIGVRSLTTYMVMNATNNIKDENGEDIDLNPDHVLRIVHAINSCDGSGIKPMTEEAIVLAEAFKTDYSMVSALDFISLDDNKDLEFTAYDSVLGRRYYTGTK